MYLDIRYLFKYFLSFVLILFLLSTDTLSAHTSLTYNFYVLKRAHLHKTAKKHQKKSTTVVIIILHLSSYK